MENRKIYDRQYRQNNKEKILQRMRDFRKNHPDKIKQYQEKYRKNNKKKIADYARQFKKDNPQKIRDRNENYKKNHNDKILLHNREYRKKVVENLTDGYICDLLKVSVKDIMSLELIQAKRQQIKLIRTIKNQKNEHKREINKVS